MQSRVLAFIHNTNLIEVLQPYQASYAWHWITDAPITLPSETTDTMPTIRKIIQLVTDINPALIIVETDIHTWHIEKWLPLIHADPATRRIPIIAIADNALGMAQASAANANVMLSIAEFTAALPNILDENLRVLHGVQFIDDECQMLPPPLVLQGLAEFNRGEFFECHETLEHAWNQERRAVRELYRAILQVGIAYYQIQRKNYHGALKMFLRSVQWFAYLPDSCQGVNVAQLKQDANAARAHLEALGEDRIAEFDQALLKPIQYQASADPFRHE